MGGRGMNEAHKERTIEKLKRELGNDILEALYDPNVIEVMANSDLTLWVEKLGQEPERIGTTNSAAIKAVIGTVASSIGSVATVEKPIVEGELPLDGSRFAGILPPIVSNPSFTIRKKATKIITLNEYVESGIMTLEQGDLIREALAKKHNIIVCGGTGSGKTTLVNAVIDALCHIAPDDRLVIIEDTNELQCNAKNKEILRASKDVSQQDLLKVTLRLRPDRIITGEVRGGEALTLLKSWNTGHPGGICTLHANSAIEALTRLEQMIGEVSDGDMADFISNTVDLVIFIEKNKGTPKRKVKEMMQVNSNNHQTSNHYETVFLTN
jgi:type IV secretion system protein VirB11